VIGLRVWLVLGLISGVLDFVVRRRAYQTMLRTYPAWSRVGGLVVGVTVQLLLGPIGAVGVVFRKKIGISERDERMERGELPGQRKA